MSASCANDNAREFPISLMMKRVLQLFREKVDEAVHPYGLTSAQLKVLAVLEREPGISGAKLARSCMVTPQTTQVLLRGIEASGWILRRKHPENDRILLATLTPAGKRMLTRSRTAVSRIYDQMLRGITPREVLELQSLLACCASNLESASKMMGEPSRPRQDKRHDKIEDARERGRPRRKAARGGKTRAGF